MSKASKLARAAKYRANVASGLIDAMPSRSAAMPNDRAAYVSAASVQEADRIAFQKMLDPVIAACPMYCGHVARHPDGSLRKDVNGDAIWVLDEILFERVRDRYITAATRGDIKEIDGLYPFPRHELVRSATALQVAILEGALDIVIGSGPVFATNKAAMLDRMSVGGMVAHGRKGSTVWKALIDMCESVKALGSARKRLDNAKTQDAQASAAVKYTVAHTAAMADIAAFSAAWLALHPGASLPAPIDILVSMELGADVAPISIVAAPDKNAAPATDAETAREAIEAARKASAHWNKAVRDNTAAMRARRAWSAAQDDLGIPDREITLKRLEDQKIKADRKATRSLDDLVKFVGATKVGFVAIFNEITEESERAIAQ